jgi:hypothetical protein
MELQMQTTSLANLLNYFTNAEWRGEFLPSRQKSDAIRYFVPYFTDQGPYLGFSIPDDDFEEGLRLFTGERIRTRLGIHSILGLEIARSLAILDGFQLHSGYILDRVNQRVQDKCYARDFCVMGECSYCALTFWRYLLAAHWPDGVQRIESYLAALKNARDGNGRWYNFPFYYTLFVLLETDLPAARAELAYARAACSRGLSANNISQPYLERRKKLMESVLNYQEISSMQVPLGV